MNGSTEGRARLSFCILPDNLKKQTRIRLTAAQAAETVSQLQTQQSMHIQASAAMAGATTENLERDVRMKCIPGCWVGFYLPTLDLHKLTWCVLMRLIDRKALCLN